MNVGRLRHRVVIHNVTEVISTLGEPVITYSTGATVWAAIRPSNGRENFESMQFQTKIDTLITTRYWPNHDSTSMQGVTPKSLLTHTTGNSTVDYYVEWVQDPEERHIELNFFCFRVQP